MKWVGIFGGSFNPPHLGHLLASVYALKVFELDEVWFMPAYTHRFQKELAPFSDRVEMCKRLIDGLSPKIKVSTFERDHKSDGRTLKTLLALRKKYPKCAFSLVIGSDILKQAKKWYRFKEIEQRFWVLVVPRGPNKKFAIPNISSTEIRKRLRAGKRLDELVTPGVEAFLRSNSTPDRSSRRR